MLKRSGDPHRSNLIGMCFKTSVACLSLSILVMTGNKVAQLFGISDIPPIYILVMSLGAIFAVITFIFGIYLIILEIGGVKLLQFESNIQFYPENDAPNLGYIRQHTGLSHENAIALFEIRNNPNANILVTGYIGNRILQFSGKATGTVLLRGHHYPMLQINDWHDNEKIIFLCQFIETIELY